MFAKRDTDKARRSDRRRYARDPERRQARNKAWQKRNAAKVKAKKAIAFKRWKEENPEAYRAHTATGNAIRDGRLLRKPCEVCGSKKVDAHHDDYSKALDVRWLCRKHHALLHKERRALPF